MYFDVNIPYIGKMKKIVIRTQTVQGVSSRFHQIIEDGQTLSESIQKNGKEYFIREVFGEKNILLSELDEEYNNFIISGKSEFFGEV